MLEPRLRRGDMVVLDNLGAHRASRIEEVAAARRAQVLWLVPYSKRFHTAERTLEGIEAVNMIRKGQVKGLAGSDAIGQARFVASPFQIAA